MTETNIGIPQQTETQTCGGTHHTVVLVLIDPAVTLLSLNHELVVTETSINKCVDEGACKVTSSRVDG